MASVSFAFDLASPYAYLTAERLAGRADVIWQPVLVGAIFKLRGHGSWGHTDQRQAGVDEIEARARRYGLPPMAWPEGWPLNALQAMRAALWAQDQDALEPFALAVYRREFQRGEDIADVAVLQAAARDAGLDGDALPAAIADPAIKARLKDVTDAAWEAGVVGVPCVTVGGTVYFGDDRLDEALAAAAAG
jgi:2-hydroxychromene-2-carboxylate isomerase